jgi:hypothetical protein
MDYDSFTTMNYITIERPYPIDFNGGACITLFSRTSVASHCILDTEAYGIAILILTTIGALWVVSKCIRC